MSVYFFACAVVCPFAQFRVTNRNTYPMAQTQKRRSEYSPERLFVCVSSSPHRTGRSMKERLGDIFTGVNSGLDKMSQLFNKFRNRWRILTKGSKMNVIQTWQTPIFALMYANFCRGSPYGHQINNFYWRRRQGIHRAAIADPEICKPSRSDRGRDGHG